MYNIPLFSQRLGTSQIKFTHAVRPYKSKGQSLSNLQTPAWGGKTQTRSLHFIPTGQLESLTQLTIEEAVGAGGGGGDWQNP